MLTKEQNRLFNGKSMVAVMENAVRAEMIRVVGRISAQVNVINQISGDDGKRGDAYQSIRFDKTPETPSQIGEVLKRVGRELTVG
ncbi:hypothetical protein [Eubacterium aggregans]|uniref:hypothetical protein n=1 Tax=Eubacterium aggregans TaxID=81409 RepID=UPI003F39B0D6